MRQLVTEDRDGRADPAGQPRTEGRACGEEAGSDMVAPGFCLFH